MIWYEKINNFPYFILLNGHVNKLDEKSVYRSNALILYRRCRAAAPMRDIGREEKRREIRALFYKKRRGLHC